VTFTARPKPERVFGTQPSGVIFTIEGYVKPEKPDRVNVFKTEPTGIVHTIEGYVKPEKPDRVNVFKTKSEKYYENSLQLSLVPFEFIHPKSQVGVKGSRWELDRPIGYSTRLAIDQRTGLTRAILVFKIKKLKNYPTDPRLYIYVHTQNGEILYDGKRTINVGGLDYFKEDRIDRSAGIFLEGNTVLESVDITLASKTGWNQPAPLGSSGKIYGSAVLVDDTACDNHVNFEGCKFLPISNSIDFDLQVHKEVIASTPAEPEIDDSGQKEVPGEQAQLPADLTLDDPYADFVISEPEPMIEPDPVEPDPVVTPEPVSLLPYVIGIGVAIGVGSVVLKNKGAKFW